MEMTHETCSSCLERPYPHLVSPLSRILIHELHFGCVSGSEFAQQEEDGHVDDTLKKRKKENLLGGDAQVMDGAAALKWGCCRFIGGLGEVEWRG